MRRVAWILLLLFVFALPWEYSLDIGEPIGNIARVLGLLLLLAIVPAIFQSGTMRHLGALQWLALAFYLWICCSVFWRIGFKPIGWVTWMVSVNVCSTVRSLPRKRGSVPWTRADVR